MKTYTTKQGDTWDGIAYVQMGDCSYTKDLMWANQKYLQYLTFPAGITLTLPEKGVPIDSSAPPWKKVSHEQ